MKKRLLLIVTIILLFCICFSGCLLSSKEEKFIGHWSDSYGMTEMKFYTDLWSKKVDYYLSGIKYTLDWSIDDNKLCFKGDVSNAEMCWIYQFLDSKTLYLELVGGGVPLTLIKN